MTKTARELGYRWPAEWEPHAATWLSWPHNQDTWPGAFHQAVAEYARFVEVISKFEPVNVLAGSGLASEAAQHFIGKLSNITIYDVPTNDAWIRDHGPTFICPKAPTQQAETAAILDWQYNAWGNKYPPFNDDNDVPRRISEITRRRRFKIDFVLEGGAIDGNGAGIVMTTESCVLNPTRNRATTRDKVQRLLCDNLSADHVLWLCGDIPGDDTDGHIDQLARFVNVTTVLVSTSNELPQLRENLRTIEASGHGLKCIELPMPTPKYLDAMRLPTSYANFYIVNGAVIVPEFKDSNDRIAQQILSDCFPERQIIGLPALALVVGLGAFHCLSQQEPVASRI